jgi:GNAT superfamily N-acetyltransferase
MTLIEPMPYQPSMRADLVCFLNEGYADLRALPAVGVEAPDYPEFTEGGLSGGQESGAETWVVADRGTILSAASWHHHADQSCGLVDFVATHPAHRHQGHASRLLWKCEAWARRLDLERTQTARFVDSRAEAACGLFESCGFEVREPNHMNTTWEIDIDRWQPRKPGLPRGYRVVTFQPGDEAAWVDLHKAVFGGSATVEWFKRRFRDLPNFDPQGWHFIEGPRGKVGMAGAIVWFHDPGLTRPTGALVEWVGVLEQERGKNLGEALMVSCLNYLKRRAVEPNCIVTQYAREAAVGLYKKLGYRFVRECRTYVKRQGPGDRSQESE